MGAFGTAVILVIAALVVVLVLVVAAQGRGGRITWIDHLLGRIRRAQVKREDGLVKVSSFDDEQGWTPAVDMPLSAFSPGRRARRIALGHPTKNRRPVRDLMVYSHGDTPTGIVSGATGSWKSSSVLAEAVLMHGRDENGQLLRNPDGSVGAPMFLAAPKTELIELCLKSREAQGKVVIIDVGGGKALPVGGSADEYGRVRPELRNYLGNWSPLSECDTWEGALATARSMCSGVAPGGEKTGDFWEASASRLVAAALWAVRHRGPGTCLLDVYKAINTQQENPDNEKKTVPPLHALATELEAWFLTPEDTEQAKRLAEDAEMAHTAIADLVNGAEATIGSIRNTATTALSAALVGGVARVAWDADDALNIEELLVDTNGTIVLLGSFSELRDFRPVTSALIDATRRRLEARALAAGGRLERQVLVVVDEVTTIVGGGELFAEWLASARSQHVQILWAAQDIAGLDANFGKELRTRILNNTVSRMWLPFSADVEALELIEKLGGDHLVWLETHTEGSSDSTSAGSEGGGKSRGKNHSIAKAQSVRPLIPQGRAAAMREGEATLILADKRHQLALRQWFRVPMLKSIVEHGHPGDHAAMDHDYTDDPYQQPQSGDEPNADLPEEEGLIPSPETRERARRLAQQDFDPGSGPSGFIT